MMDGGSITSEPQFQEPDQGNSEISIRMQEPVQPVIQEIRTEPVVVPQPTSSVTRYAYDPYYAKKFMEKIGNSVIIVNRIDWYANSIPLGAACNAIAFIVYGFYRCKVYNLNDQFMWAVILFFGGIGQCTAGYLEYLKGRTFPTTLYLMLGFYCLSHFAFYIIPLIFQLQGYSEMVYPINPASVCAYYSGWVVISFALALGSVRTNVLYVCQCLATFAFFLLRAIGEGSHSLATKRNAAGILEVIAGFFSLLVCMSQVINDAFGSTVFPPGQLHPDNEIDRAPKVAAKQ